MLNNNNLVYFPSCVTSFFLAVLYPSEKVGDAVPLKHNNYKKFTTNCISRGMNSILIDIYSLFSNIILI